MNDDTAATPASTAAPLTLMAVHAHPDDECFGTGGVFARYGAEGVRTVLVTATGGEEGEIHDPDLNEEEARPRLKEIREQELRRAVAVLGITELELLGYRDSGMVGTPANENPANFHNAPLDEATGLLVRLIRKHRPQVIVTYNEDGGYGHPDHIKCHVVTRAAFDAAGDPARYPDAGPPWTPLKLYATAWSRERWRDFFAILKERGLELPFSRGDDDAREGEATTLPAEGTAEQVAAGAVAPPEDTADAEGSRQGRRDEEWGQPEETITTFVDTHDFWEARREALRQHRTQPVGFFLNLPGDLAELSGSTEYFILLASRVAQEATARPEHDLFAGVRAGASQATAAAVAAK